MMSTDVKDFDTDKVKNCRRKRKLMQWFGAFSAVVGNRNISVSQKIQILIWRFSKLLIFLVKIHLVSILTCQNMPPLSKIVKFEK